MLCPGPRVARPPSPDIHSGPPPHSRGALVFFHGGGYVLGTLDNEQQSCSHFASKVGCVVVSPDYRLAPEHPFPAALDDCFRRSAGSPKKELTSGSTQAG